MCKYRKYIVSQPDTSAQREKAVECGTLFLNVSTHERMPVRLIVIFKVSYNFCVIFKSYKYNSKDINCGKFKTKAPIEHYKFDSVYRLAAFFILRKKL